MAWAWLMILDAQKLGRANASKQQVDQAYIVAGALVLASSATYYTVGGRSGRKLPSSNCPKQGKHASVCFASSIVNNRPNFYFAPIKKEMVTMSSVEDGGIIDDMRRSKYIPQKM